MLRRYHFVIIAGIFALLAAANAIALDRTTTRRTRHYHHVRRVAWTPMFRGSHDMLVRENLEIDRLELPRIEDDEQLVALEESQELVPLAESRQLDIAGDLKPNRRYCRPWTRDFVGDFAQAYYEEFHQPIRVTSLVRTAKQQKRLRRRNRNAGPIEGETASTHLTGISVDISRRGLTRKQREWIQQYLLPLQAQGFLEPVEERRQAVFHVVVYDSYSEWRENGKLAGN